MERDTRDMTGRDDILAVLYGTTAVSKAEKTRGQKIQENVALATNAGGAVAAPAAIYGAVRSRKEGGFFRDMGAAAGRNSSKIKLKPARKAMEGAGRVAGNLNKPGNKKWKAAAGVAGATMIGLQGLNAAGDTIAARMIAQQKKQDKVKKSNDLPMGKKITLHAVKTVEESARKNAPRAKKAVKAASDTWKAEAQVSKSFEDKREVYGWASITEMNGEPVVDRQGDFVTIEEIEKAAHKYVAESRKGGNMHKREGEAPVHVADLIESVVITPEKKEALGLPADSPTGWWIGMKVHDDETWRQIKDGERPMFSIHGSGRRVDREDMVAKAVTIPAGSPGGDKAGDRKKAPYSNVPKAGDPKVARERQRNVYRRIQNRNVRQANAARAIKAVDNSRRGMVHVPGQGTFSTRRRTTGEKARIRLNQVGGAARDAGTSFSNASTRAKYASAGTRAKTLKTVKNPKVAAGIAAGAVAGTAAGALAGNGKKRTTMERTPSTNKYGY